MAEKKSIHEFSTGTPQAQTAFVVDTPNASAESGYITEKVITSDLGNTLLGTLNYTQSLDTESKNIFGAVNELNSIANEANSKATSGQGTLTAQSCTLNAFKLVRQGSLVVTHGQLTLTSDSRAWVNAFKLPSGFFPSTAGYIMAYNVTASGAGLINVRTDGNCQFVNLPRFTAGDSVYFFGTWAIG